MATPSNRPPATNKAVFIAPGGAMEIRMVSNDVQTLCSAAQTLKARYFVAADGWCSVNSCPIWGVFDMRTAQRDGGGPRQWSIRDPVKTFTTKDTAAAVMYAMMLHGRNK